MKIDEQASRKVVTLHKTRAAIIKRAKRLYYHGQDEPIFWGDLPAEVRERFIKHAEELANG